MKDSYNLPQELRSRLLLLKWFSVSDLFLVAGFFAVGLLLKNLITPELQTFLVLFFSGIGIISCIKTKTNPGKTFIEATLLYLTRDKETYHPISTPKETKETIYLGVTRR